MNAAEKIVATAVQVTGWSTDALTGRWRDQSIVRVRFAIAYVGLKRTNPKRLAGALRRDPSTISHYRAKAAELVERDAAFRLLCERIEAAL